jgi:trimeric autotransporter adhesin
MNTNPTPNHSEKSFLANKLFNYTKTGLLALSIMSGIHAVAQNGNSNANAQGANWNSNGNAATSVSYLGTTTPVDLIFKTSAIQRGLFDTQGKFIVKDINNGGGGVVLDGVGNGGIKINPGLLNRPIPTNPIAAYMLKVGGSGIFEGEVNAKRLFVEEYITFMKLLKGPRIDVDSIKMDSTRGIYGQTKIVGDLTVKQKLTVEGDAVFKNNLTAEKGILFDNANGIGYMPATSTSAAIYRFGPASTFTVAPSEISCPTPFSNTQYPLLLTNGSFISRIPLGTGTGSVNSSLRMFSAPWDGSGIIEVEGRDNNGSDKNGLLLNFFCGRNTYINTNNALDNQGGKVFLGERVSMAKNVGIGSNYPNENFSVNTALNIYANENNQTALKLNVWNGTVKAIDIVNPGNNVSSFTIMQNGDAMIGGTLKLAQFANISGNTVAYFDANGNLKQGNSYNSVQSACVAGADSWHIGGDNIIGMTAGDKAIGTCDNEDFVLKSNGTKRMWIKASTGAIGIGNSAPSARLMIDSESSNLEPNFYSRTLPTSGQSYNTYIEHSTTNQFFRAFAIGYRNTANNITTENFVVFANGRTTIGAKKVISGPYTNAMLSVYGTIAATEVQVFNNSWWADYVFENNYKLMPLNEVEQFYKANHHLPNVPSKAEVEEKGTNLAEVDATLLRKIEENTIYLVEINKKLEQLAKENEELKAKVKLLEGK